MAVLYERSRVPLYVQVASVMRRRIDKGQWMQGDKISSLEELEAEFGVARVTIRQAIELLRDEGLLNVQQGRGTFVSGQTRHNRWLNLGIDLDSAVASLSENVAECINIIEHAEQPDLADHEGRPADDYTFLHSVQYNHGEPFSTVSLYLASSIYARNPKGFAHAAALPMVMGMTDLTVAHAYQTVTIGVADPETAEQLKIGLGEPIADTRLVLVDDGGIAIYVADIHYKKDCIEIHVDLMDSKLSAQKSDLPEKSRA